MCNCKTFWDYIPDAAVKFGVAMAILAITIALIAVVIDKKNSNKENIK